ncbi:predicted protein [Micromonas commoda]|uniref:Sfi1 spindle body domain-containing protein n=1 Tax=Micromonas commoda (strain RCC299 / NOUM17 / CCMP2709) TaxID=296587 RepID=C1EF64_MICCC|nr:predicted protein [Micromonas commoda]ACO66795.1 predicted protein [Micromonas commoda]|eukprot:XP_002505537.1 predicted protein [Micromonas commoda]
MVPGGGAFDRAGGGDDDIVSLAPSTSTLAGDDDARVSARRNHDSPPRDLSRHQIPPSTSRSHRSGLSDGGSTRPFRASVSAPARTWRTRALSLIVESDGATSEWVLRVDPSQLSSPDERGDSVGSTLVFGGFDATRLRVRAGPSRAPRDAGNAVDADDPPGGEDPGVRWVSLTRMGGGSEEIPTFFYRVDDDASRADDDDAVTMSFAVADGMGSFGSPVGATTISSASVAASTADPSQLASEVEDESESPDVYRISPWMPGSAASSLRDPTPRVHRPTDGGSNVHLTPGPEDDTPRRLTFERDGDDIYGDDITGGQQTESPPSEGTALLAAVMAEVSTPSRFTGVTNLTQRLGLGAVGAVAVADTPSSVRQATNGEVFPEDVESSFEKSFDGGYGGEDVEAAIDAGEQVLTPTLARAMRRVGAASTSPSTCSSTSASTSASARVPLLDAWRTERTTSAAFRVWRMSAVLTNQERERATLIRLRNEAIAAGIPPSPIATLLGGSASEAPSSPTPSSASGGARETFSFGCEAAAFTPPSLASSAREGPDATAASSASAATQTPTSVTADAAEDTEDAAEDTEDAAEAARSAAKLRRLGENVSSIRAAARLEESDAIRRRERETRLVASCQTKTRRRIAGTTLRAWWAAAFREVTARRLAAAARIAADCHVLAAEGAARADAFIAHAHNRAVRASNARSVTRAFETWANEAAKTASLRRRLAWGKVSTDWREKRSSFARWVRFVDDSIAANEARLVAVTRILTRVFARAMREGFTAWKTRSEDARRARRNAIVAFKRFAARKEARFGREMTQAWRTHVMEGISRRRAVMTRLDAEDRTALNAFRLCARSELRRRRDRVRRWRTFAVVRRLRRELFASALSNVRRRWDESVANARRAALGAWRAVAAKASRRRRNAERVEWAVDLCVRSATRLGPRRCWRDDYRSVVADVFAGWKLAVASAHTASKLVHQTATAMARHRAERVKRECVRAWRDWHRERAAEWDRVRQIRRSEIAAFTHRFNARLRARRAQFRAWRLETKTGALTRERRWRKVARVTVGVAVRDGAARTMLFARVFRDWHRFSFASARERRDAEAHDLELARVCETRVCDRYRREPFRGWRRLTWTNAADRAVAAYANAVRRKLSNHATRMSHGRRREGARGTLRRWREAVEKERVRSLVHARAEAMHTRRAVHAPRADAFLAWRVVTKETAGFREKSYAAMNRRTRRRTRAVFHAWHLRAVSIARAFVILRSLARVERARRGFLDASDSFRGWRGAVSRAASSRFSAALTARAARRLARDLASRRLQRVVRVWYAIAGAGVAHPERRRAHDVAVAAHRKATSLKLTARAFASWRVAVERGAVTAVTADATRVKCAAVAGWRARRVTREVFWALVRAAERGARFRAQLCAVARDSLIASGKTFLRRWREMAMASMEARRTHDALETLRARSERRDAWRRLATWRRAVRASRTLTNREARADRFAARRRRVRCLAPALSAWIAFARARTAQRVVNERALVSAARLRARIERSTTRGVFEAWLAVTKALRRLAYDVAAFAEDRNARTLTDVLATWRWRAVASTEARQFAVTLERRAGVQCVRAWRKHCVDKSAECRSLRRRYARVVTRRMARRLRQWRINAVHAIAARGSIAAANARVMERAINERYERYVFHAWRWHVAWSNGYAEAVSQLEDLRNRDASRAVFCRWRFAANDARRLAACERRVATRRWRSIKLECVWALAIHASRSRRLRSFAARHGRAPSAASTMTPIVVVSRVFAEWRSRAAEAAADREREALVARGATARARRLKLPPCVREWRRVAREAARAVLAAETRFGAKTEALKFRAFRAFIASVYRAKDAASARERELTRAMEVRSRAREVLAEAEMIANRTSVEFDPLCAEPAEVDATDEVDAVDRVAAAAAGIAALPAPPPPSPPPSSHLLLHPPVVAPAATIESIDESAIFDLSADEQDVSIADDDDKNLTPRDAPNEKEKEAEAAVVAVAPPSAHSREYEVAYKAAYDAALAAAEAEAAALRARLADTHYDASRPVTNRNTHLSHVLDDKENAGGRENDAGKRRTGASSHSSFASVTYAKVYHEGVSSTGGTARAPGGTLGDAMLGPVRGARTAKALRAADAILGRHERNDGYGHGSAEGYSRVYHHR